MRPTLLDFDLPGLGAIEIPAYLSFLLLGFVVAIVYSRRMAERHGLSGVAMIDLGLLMLVCGVIGSRLLAVLTDGHLMDFVYLCTDPTRVPANGAGGHPPRDCLAALKFWNGGLTYYGGFLLAVPVGLWFARRRSLEPLEVADLVSPAIMLGLAIGRWGCFLNGCCYGARSDGPLAVTLPGRYVSQHPSQLYESAICLLLFALLHAQLDSKRRAPGDVFALLLVLYGAARIVLELFRADPRGAFGPLSTSQLLSIPLIGAGVWLFTRVRRTPPSDRKLANSG